MKVVAIIQARMGSSRLPGKVLCRLAGKTVLAHVIERARAVAGVHAVVVATTTGVADEAVAQEALQAGAQAFRGSEHDVLDRYYRAGSEAGADIVIRITSDCPLLDPKIVTAMLERFMRSDSYDYMSNGLCRTFPRGLDAEIFSMAALRRAHAKAQLPYEREHVTPFIYQHPDEFRIHSFEGERNLSAYRWTLDTPEDLEMLTRLFEVMPACAAMVTMHDVLQVLSARPDIAAINAGVPQKALGE